MASQLQTQGFCATCNQERLFTKPGMNHLVHALVSLFLCGLWLPIWILAAAANGSEPYRCVQCGSKASGSSARAFVALAVVVFVVWVIAASFLYSNYSGGSKLGGRGPAAHTPESARPAASPSAEDEAKPQRDAVEALVRAQQAASEEKKRQLAANALKFHQDLADKGDAYGQYMMGLRYMNGDGVEKDWFKASDYLGKASVQGRADAAAELTKLLASRASKTN